MTEDELDDLLRELEAATVPVVQEALDATAAEFAKAVNGSTSLVAAAFSVSRIAGMWKRHVSPIMQRLRAVADRSVAETAADVGADVPEPEAVDAALSDWDKATRALLDGVGDTLAQEAQDALAAGLSDGDSPEQLRARMLAVFSDSGNALGPNRANRIAGTESTRAFNAGALASAQALTGPDRPLVKQWITRRDTRVREAHRDANGQIQFLDDPFDVGGFPMRYPGDPTAPADLTINCRCILRATAPARPTEGTASMGDATAAAGDLASNMPPQLKAYWLTGPGAAKIVWGTPGAFERCVTALRDDFPKDPEGLCANLYHDATGRWPGANRDSEAVHSGAMIALMPSVADAERMALLDGEAADQLHLTLYYLGDAVDWSEHDRADVRNLMSNAAGWLTSVRAKAFGYATWNPASDEPATVWNIGDGDSPTSLHDVHREVTYQLEDGHYEADFPVQHSPWSPHVCATYGEADPAAMAAGCGPITFDRIRVAFGGEYTDFPLLDEMPEDDSWPEDDYDAAEAEAPAPVAGWTTPDPAALAFENQQTGDGRIITPGAIYWDEPGPWPLMAREDFSSHDEADLAGSIEAVSRVGDRIAANGDLYLTQVAGARATRLLAQGAPLGVSVDLDDVDVEMVDASPGSQAQYRARFATASLLPLDGGFLLIGETEPDHATASQGFATASRSERLTIMIGPDGRVPGAVFDIAAAAGETNPDGEVLDAQRSGDYLMRITRARLRGATLVTIPAYAGARIVLDDPEMFASDTEGETVKLTPVGAAPADLSAAAQTSDYERVLRHVRRSNAPAGAARISQFLGIPLIAVQRHLSRAAARGEVVRLSRGLYTDRTTSAKADHVMWDDMAAAVTGSVSLPVADSDTAWDGQAATDRVFEWADGDTGKIADAFAYREDGADPALKGSYKLGYADVVDGALTIVPRGASAALAAVNGGRGGVDIPADQIGDVRQRLESVLAHVHEVNGQDSMDEMQASAWRAMQDLPAMPAEWFREPTAAELPPGAPGVNYANGRIFGWVAQANEPHAGYAKRVVINDLGRIDTSHFLRQRFNLDDGSTVKAGAFTMNAGHHRDGAECETSACQFDDTRTVAGIVTVGMNERGMWFSGAAAPWMSEWDRQVFAATQPSYHMKRSDSGQWQLRAVLSVPVPGHSSPLLASAVIERSQTALTAAAAMFEVEEVVAAEQAREAASQGTGGGREAPTLPEIVAAVVTALDERDARAAAERAELEELLNEGRSMNTETTGAEGV